MRLYEEREWPVAGTGWYGQQGLSAVQYAQTVIKERKHSMKTILWCFILLAISAMVLGCVIVSG